VADAVAVEALAPSVAAPVAASFETTPGPAGEAAADTVAATV
jgi:hypothetical protein